MPKPTVYLETSVISYLTARPSRDLIVAAHQQITHEWWEDDRVGFDLYISLFVQQEAAGGDPQAAQKRFQVVSGLALLDVTDEVGELAAIIMAQTGLPTKAGVDALHMAVAAVNNIDYLLTWNCKHIANAALRPQIEAVCRAGGYKPPVLCTPEELRGL